MKETPSQLTDAAVEADHACLCDSLFPSAGSRVALSLLATQDTPPAVALAVLLLGRSQAQVDSLADIVHSHHGFVARIVTGRIPELVEAETLIDGIDTLICGLLLGTADAIPDGCVSVAEMHRQDENAKASAEDVKAAIAASAQAQHETAAVCNHRDGHLIYYCPGCKKEHAINLNPEARHIWKGEDGVQHDDPIPSWQWNGSFAMPIVTPSVNCDAGTDRTCHHYIRAGFIEFLGDCKHELAGQIVPMSPVKPE